MSKKWKKGLLISTLALGNESYGVATEWLKKAMGTKASKPKPINDIWIVDVYH